jgi:glucosamine--fructose-6-phosphate aminotransferase (isomerizing)
MSQFLKEIAEQPECLLELAALYRGAGRARLQQWARLARRHRRAVFAGMGTSEFAPSAILDALARRGLDADTRDAGEWLHYPRTRPPLTVLISQSGESIETRQLADKLKNKTKLVAITNNEKSSLARAADLVLPMAAGAESAISTKTYVNTLAVLYLMAKALESAPALDRGLRCLAQTAETMLAVDRPAIARAARLLADAPAIHFIARGPALAAARQAALTFMEGTRTAAVAHAGGAFRHGPFELADASWRGVFFIPAGPTRRLLAAMAAEVLEKKGRAVVITDAAVKLKERGGQVLRVPAHGEALFALSAATTQELLLHAVAAARGVVAGQFRYGRKITARE